MAGNREIERDVAAALAHLGIPHEILPCDPEAADTPTFCSRYGYPLEHTGNTILVASRKEPRKYAACVVAASTRLDVNHKVRALLAVPRLSFASADETVRITGMQAGGVTPFALPEDIPVFVDERLMSREYVILGGGGRSTKIRIAPGDLRRLMNVRVVSGLAIEGQP